MPYDSNSMNNFVQKQGGSLANLGASPTYTGAPAARGTPPGGMDPNPAQQAYGNANQNAAFQPNPAYPRNPYMPTSAPAPVRPGMPYPAPGQYDPRMAGNNSLSRLGVPAQRPTAVGAPGRRPQMRNLQLAQNPEMRRRQQMMLQQANPNLGNLSRLGISRSQRPRSFYTPEQAAAYTGDWQTSAPLGYSTPGPGRRPAQAYTRNR